MYIFTKQIHIANVYIYYISTTLYQEKSRNFRPQDPLFHIVSKCQKDLKNGHRLFTLVQWHRFSPKEEQNLPQSVSLQWVKSCFMFSLIHYISSLPLLNPTSVRDHLLGLRRRLTRSWLKCINAPWSVLCSGDPTLLDLAKLSKQLNVPFSIREGLTKAIKVSGKA